MQATQNLNVYRDDHTLTMHADRESVLGCTSLAISIGMLLTTCTEHSVRIQQTCCGQVVNDITSPCYLLQDLLRRHLISMT